MSIFAKKMAKNNFAYNFLFILVDICYVTNYRKFIEKPVYNYKILCKMLQKAQ